MSYEEDDEPSEIIHSAGKSVPVSQSNSYLEHEYDPLEYECDTLN